MTLNKKQLDTKGFVFDIQGLSVHDGPGCRTLIFLNGCTLNCFWCSNPEGVSKNPSLLYFSSKCILCGNCVRNCPQNAIKIENDKLVISRQICELCSYQSCVEECYTDALRSGGYETSVSNLFEIIQRDRQFWGSEGGVTLTGGEPLFQIDFAKEILAKCHQAYIHTAIETCGNVPWENFRKVIPYLDWIFFDLKHIDDKVHRKGTSSGNSLILDNARELANEFEGKLMFRLPLIPGFNDSHENIEAVISFIKKTGKEEINVLPIHHLGRGKYQTLDKEYLGIKFPVPSYEKQRNIQEAFRKAGINCYIGSETPF